MSPAATHTIPGYRVTKTDDKTIFHHVPIFAECDRGDDVFDSNWITAAVAAAKQQERDGYLPPLHTRHHEPATDQTDAVRAIGVFRILEAGPLTLKSKRIMAIFADLIVTDEYMADEISRMRFPYRSVEIFDLEGPPKIDGLALLDHEAPYLELPMLFASEIEDKRDQKRLAHERSGGAIPDTGVASAINPSFSLNYACKPGDPMLGSARHGKRAVLLFRFPDEDSMTKTKTKKPAAFAGDNGDDDKERENMGEDEGSEEGGGTEEGGSMDIGAVVKAIESGDISVADMDAIVAAIQSLNSEVVADEEADEPAPAPAPGAEIMKKGGITLGFARIQGENDALKARLDARDAADKRRDDVAVAMKRLEGKPLGADLEKHLISFHKEAEGNAVLFKAYVDTMARTAGELPADNDGEHFSAQPQTPKSAMAFQELGGEAVDKATTFARQYQQMKGIRASEASYVRINMRHIGYEIEEAVTA